MGTINDKRVSKLSWEIQKTVDEVAGEENYSLNEVLLAMAQASNEITQSQKEEAKSKR